MLCLLNDEITVLVIFKPTFYLIFHNHFRWTESLYLSALQNFVSDIFFTI